MPTTLAIVNKVTKASYVYCGEGHLFDSCLRNHTSVNYIGNYNIQN